MKVKSSNINNQHKRIDRILYPLVLAIFVIIMAIYGQNIFSQWNVITGDYENNKDIVVEMSANMAGNINLSTRMFESQAIEESNKIFNDIENFYKNRGTDLKTADLGQFITPIQDLWLDITILDNESNTVNEKAKTGGDSYKLSDFSGARNFADSWIKEGGLSNYWITISTQTDVIIKYAYKPTSDGEYFIELAANLVSFNPNIDVYDIESYANDLAKNFEFVDSAYVFNTQGISTSNFTNENPRLIENNLKDVFDKSISTMQAVESTKENWLGYSETLWAIPVNVSIENDKDVFYNYAMILVFDNNETMNYFYAQAIINFLIALMALAIVLLIFIRNSRQYLKPLSGLTKSIKLAANGNYNSKVVKSGSNSMKKTIIEYNGLLDKINDAIQTKENAYFQTINALVSAIDASDTYTGGHCTRVMEMSILLGKKINLTDEEMKVLRYGALLHDIGKIGIDTSIVNKKGKLTSDEYIKIKTHPTVGLSIISNIDYLNQAKRILEEHHERWDGTGYPSGLMGEEAGILSRIVTIADAYDAMASSRSYRSILPKEKIIIEIKSNSGTQFDPELAHIFIEMLEEQAEDIENRIYVEHPDKITSWN